jgi:hypothetical protein
VSASADVPPTQMVAEDVVFGFRLRNYCRCYLW